MKYAIQLVALLFLVNYTLPSSASPMPTDKQANTAPSSVTIGEVAPDIMLSNMDNQSLSLSDLRNNMVLLHFWVSWDPQSRANNKELRNLYYKYKNTAFKNGQGLAIFTVSLDNEATKWQQAVQSDQLPGNYHVNDPQSRYAALYHLNKTPATFLIDGTGTVVAKDLELHQMDKILANGGQVSDIEVVKTSAPATYTYAATPSTNNATVVTTYNDAKVPTTYNDAKVPTTYNDAKVPTTYNDAKVPTTYNDAKVPTTYNDAKVPTTYSDQKTPTTYSYSTPTPVTKVSQTSADWCKIQLGAYKKLNMNKFQPAAKYGTLTTETSESGIQRVFIGAFNSNESATATLSQLKQAGYKDAFIVCDNHQVQEATPETFSIPVQETVTNEGTLIIVDGKPVRVPAKEVVDDQIIVHQAPVHVPEQTVVNTQPTVRATDITTYNTPTVIVQQTPAKPKPHITSVQKLENYQAPPAVVNTLPTIVNTPPAVVQPAPRPNYQQNMSDVAVYTAPANRYLDISGQATVQQQPTVSSTPQVFSTPPTTTVATITQGTPTKVGAGHISESYTQARGSSTPVYTRPRSSSTSNYVTYTRPTTKKDDCDCDNKKTHHDHAIAGTSHTHTHTHSTPITNTYTTTPSKVYSSNPAVYNTKPWNQQGGAQPSSRTGKRGKATTPYRPTTTQPKTTQQGAWGSSPANNRRGQSTTTRPSTTNNWNPVNNNNNYRQNGNKTLGSSPHQQPNYNNTNNNQRYRQNQNNNQRYPNNNQRYQQQNQQNKNNQRYPNNNQRYQQDQNNSRKSSTKPSTYNNSGYQQSTPSTNLPNPQTDRAIDNYLKDYDFNSSDKGTSKRLKRKKRRMQRRMRRAERKMRKGLL